MKSIIIGIAGGTGSGKTTLTERLRDHFGADEVSVLNHDSYYKRHDELPYEERCKLNYDHPDSFDTELLVQHLQALRRGESVKVPVYDYTIHNRSDKTITVHPAPVIIVEGILIFASQELCDMMDMKVFVDTDADVRILRRIVHSLHAEEIGRSIAINLSLAVIQFFHIRHSAIQNVDMAVNPFMHGGTPCTAAGMGLHLPRWPGICRGPKGNDCPYRRRCTC